MEKERFLVKFAENEQELRAVYRLRYTDMLKEYRPEINLENGLDITPYDKFAKQVICIDNQNGEVVGCYRIITSDDLPKDMPFVCEEEFNIDKLKAMGERTAELSRAVVKKEYRNTMVLMLLLKFIIQYIKTENFRFVIGEASFYGVDKDVYQKEISYLAHYFPAEGYGIYSNEEYQTPLLAKEQLNVAELKRSIPPLFRAYTSFGAMVSTDTFTDREFGSVDMFILLDSKKYNENYISKLFKL